MEVKRSAGERNSGPMAQPKIRTRPEQDREQETVEARAEVLRLAREQGAKPIDSIDDLRGDFWAANETENAEDFDAWLHDLRAEEKFQSVRE
jgi:hypothetical protein